MARRSFLNDPAHWRDRAEEARTRADQMSDPQCKSAMLRIANDYELLAERAAERAWGGTRKSDCRALLGRPSISDPRTSRLSKKARDVCPGPLARLRGCYNLAVCDGWGKTMAPAK